MSRTKKSHIKELIICLVCCIIPIIWGFTHVQHFAYVDILFDEIEENLISKRQIHNGVEIIEAKEYLEETAGGQFYLTRYNTSEGDTVVSGSLRGKTTEPVVLQTLHIVGDADIYFYANNEFSMHALEEGQYNSSLFFINSKDFDIACYLPKQYRMLVNEALEYLPSKDGYLNVKKASDGFDIELITNEVDIQCCTDFMLVYSIEDLMDWESNKVDKEWLAFTMDGDNRWTYTGYYRISPNTYYPTGDNVYYRCQACYLGASFAEANPRYRVMDDMLYCIVDTMLMQQNEKGFFPSTSQSNWLYDDYGICASYYDTRFNSDLIEVFIKAYELYLNKDVYLAMQKYADFFVDFASEYGRDDGNGGIWIPDYWDDKGKIENVHTSLNHQLAEISVLYKLSDIYGRQDLSDLADKMIKAIENSGHKWVKPSYDLEYCIYPDGTYGRDDYPDLTYNDMFNIQNILEERYGKRSEAIDDLMYYKLIWMKLHYIDSYLR